MAQLTPLSKGLVGLLVVGVMASAAWHLALKERYAAWQSGTTAVTAPDPPAMPAASPAPVPTPAPVPRPAAVVAQPPKPEPPAPVAQPQTQPQQQTQPQLQAAPAKPAPARADPWADLSIDKKGSKP